MTGKFYNGLERNASGGSRFFDSLSNEEKNGLFEVVAERAYKGKEYCRSCVLKSKDYCTACDYIRNELSQEFENDRG